MLSSPALLASFTSHYTPTGPAETLLVRRIVAATLRIDLLERSPGTRMRVSLMELGERRALIDHLYERFAPGTPWVLPKMQVRDAPSYASMLRRYDGTAEIPPDFDPSLDPDPALCTLAYTLSGPRAALLMRHEATAERRLHTAMRELHRLQAARRTQEKERNEPISEQPATTFDALSYPSPTDSPPYMQPAPGKNEPITPPLSHMIHASISNEPITPSSPNKPSSTLNTKPTLLTLPTPRPPEITPMARNEPTPAPPPAVPAASRTFHQSLWDRYSVPSSHLLERAIRDVDRRAGHDQYQHGVGRQAPEHRARRKKR